jgi:hypothetical protein
VTFQIDQQSWSEAVWENVGFAFSEVEDGTGAVVPVVIATLGAFWLVDTVWLGEEGGNYVALVGVALVYVALGLGG